MHAVILALRAVHIVSGVFWAGSVGFVNVLLGPSLMAAGAAGGRVMRELRQRRYLEILTMVSTLAILSGVALLWLDSGGLAGSWLRAPIGLALSIGGAAAILAFLLGIFTIRPLVLRMDRLEGELTAASTEALRSSHHARLSALRQILARRGRLAATFLVVAVSAMALARYL